MSDTERSSALQDGYGSPPMSSRLSVSSYDVGNEEEDEGMPSDD